MDGAGNLYIADSQNARYGSSGTQVRESCSSAANAPCYGTLAFSFRQPPALLLAMICLNMALSAVVLIFSP